MIFKWFRVSETILCNIWRDGKMKKFLKKEKRMIGDLCGSVILFIVFFYMDNKKVPIDQLIFIAIFAFIIVVDLITQIKKWLQARK